MDKPSITPLGAIGRGAVAGAVGTATMDLVQYLRYKRGGGESSPIEWEFGSSAEDWDQAPAPAKVGKRLYEGFLQQELHKDKVAATNNTVHWGYGVLWGAIYGVLAGSAPVPSMMLALPFGTAVWMMQYVMLPMAHLYKPIWEYDAPTLLKDLSQHLAYGAGTAAAFALLAQGDED